ncbi:MAG: menE, partial [Akkermansiaceae bacterium]|nr:menE [Akkermansiaceae bacterium]
MEAADLTGPEFWARDTAVMMTAANEPSLAVPPLPEAAGQVFFRTSGSTGVPKWIGHTRASLLASADAVNAHLHVAATSCWGLALPLHHVGGFGVMSRAWRAGCRVAVYPDRWSAAPFASWLAEEKVTHLSLVPTQVHDLVAAGCRGPASLQAVVVGGGVLPVATGRAARELGWPVLASYGMTETASQIATRRIELLHLPYETSPIDLIDPWRVRLAEDGRLW